MAAQQTRHSHTTDAGSHDRRQAAAASPFVPDNYYTLLNVPYDATARDITKAYRQAMMRAHPDRVLPERRAAAEDLSKLLNLAYSTLSDPRKRLAYDRSIRADVVQAGIMNRYVGGPAGPGMGGAAPAPRRQMTERERRDRRRSDRSAMLSILSAFAVVAIGAIGLLVLFALASLAISLMF